MTTNDLIRRGDVAVARVEAEAEQQVRGRDVVGLLGLGFVFLLIAGGMTGGMLVAVIFALGFVLAVAGGVLAALYFTTRGVVRTVRRGVGRRRLLKTAEVDRRAGSLSVADGDEGALSEVEP